MYINTPFARGFQPDLFNQPTPNNIFLSQKTSTSQPKPTQKLTSEHGCRKYNETKLLNALIGGSHGLLFQQKKGKIGSISLKDPDFEKILSKDSALEK